MRKLRSLGSLVLLGGLSIVLVVGGASVAQIKKGKTRPMLTKHLMKGLVNEQCRALRKELGAGPSKDDAEAWEKLEMRGALLNEASYILMDDNRCPDATWGNAASKLLREGSADVLKAIKARDVEAAKKAFRGMTRACATCHKAHKKDS